jgi:predicted nucleic acid-binding protein
MFVIDASVAGAWYLPDESDPHADAALLCLARAHRLSFYDAAYLELAQRKSSPLATLDTALIKAAKAEKIPLIGAAK